MPFAVLDVHGAAKVTGDGVDLLLVGTPTQFGGRRLLVRPFLRSLRQHGFAGVDAAAFDTRSPGPGSGSAAIPVAEALTAAGCRLVMEPEGFIVSGGKGALAIGEEERAAQWARHAAQSVPVAV